MLHNYYKERHVWGCLHHQSVVSTKQQWITCLNCQYVTSEAHNNMVNTIFMVSSIVVHWNLSLWPPWNKSNLVYDLLGLKKFSLIYDLYLEYASCEHQYSIFLKFVRNFLPPCLLQWRSMTASWLAGLALLLTSRASLPPTPFFSLSLSAPSSHAPSFFLSLSRPVHTTHYGLCADLCLNSLAPWPYMEWLAGHPALDLSLAVGISYEWVPHSIGKGFSFQTITSPLPFSTGTRLFSAR